MTDNSGAELKPETGPAPAPLAQPPEALTWRVFRARETPRRTALVTVFICAVLVFVAVYWGPLMMLAAFLLLALTLNSYYLPTTYTLDERGITTDKALFRYTRPWQDFRSFIRTTSGVVISPFSSFTYLDNFRGLHLLLPADSGPVLRHLSRRLSEKQRPGRGARAS